MLSPFNRGEIMPSRKISCVIPARLASTRLPRKVLLPLAGKSLLQWTWEAASAVSLFSEVLIAADSEEVAVAARAFGAKVHLTSLECPSGTDRLVELYEKGVLHGDICVNWQADEPFLKEEMIEDLLGSKQKADVWTLKKRITDSDSIASPHVAKVVCDAQGYALYFSRSVIPHYREVATHPIIYKHIGLYAYTKEALEKIGTFPPCMLEEAEKLEQLRFLYHGLKILVSPTEHDAMGIDLPEHLVLAEKKIISMLA